MQRVRRDPLKFSRPLRGHAQGIPPAMATVSWRSACTAVAALRTNARKRHTCWP